MINVLQLKDSFLGWGLIVFLFLSLLLAMYNTLWYIKGKILTYSWLRRRVQSFQLYPPTNGTSEKKEQKNPINFWNTTFFEHNFSLAGYLNKENFIGHLLILTLLFKLFEKFGKCWILHLAEMVPCSASGCVNQIGKVGYLLSQNTIRLRLSVPLAP